MAVSDQLVECLHEMAVAVPVGQLELLADVLDTVSKPDMESRQRASALVASPRFKAAVADLWAAWESAVSVSGPSLALALRAAAHNADRMRAASSLEVVWTGPASPAVPVRHSAQVIENLIDTARQRLIIVSFAAYRVETVEERLVEAASRGVTVDLVLETTEDSKGRLDHEAANAFDALRHIARFWVWPGKLRPDDGAVLHAKAAIRDGSLALITSANLTGRALNSNMELGLLVGGGPIPGRLNDHFDSLMSSGTLVSI